jgi:hypothetical protein
MGLRLLLFLGNTPPDKMVKHLPVVVEEAVVDLELIRG